LCLLLAAALFLASCSTNDKQNILPDTTNKTTDNVSSNDNKKGDTVAADAKTGSYTRGIGLTDNNGYNLSFYKDLGFDTFIIKVNGIRSSKKPYKTNFEELKRLRKLTSALDYYKMKYMIELTSGPGYSSDSTTATIFSKEIERIYFAQMAGEVIKRYQGNKNFKGISIKLDDPDVSTEDYYKTENFIINKIRASYPDMTILYNLHPLTFENDVKDLPIMTNDKNILNLTICFKGIVYPGYGAGYKASVKLDKNGMLKRFQALKEFETKNKQHIMITIQTPWAEKSDVFLQDTFELFKMIGFDYTLCYGNSFDIFDFSKNEDVVISLM
jgi:hypothetical protein